MNKSLSCHYYVALLLCLLIAIPSWAALTPEQEAAKQKGIQLFQQSRLNEKTENYLSEAAEAGDVEAMVYLGIVYKVTMPLMANKWLEKAANQGDIYAMYQLSLDGAVWDQFGLSESKNKTNWKQKGIEASLAKAKQGDPEAMYVYYRFTGDVDWLKKAADLKYLPAQESLANAASYGKGYFAKLSKQERKKESLKLWHIAANNGSSSAANYLSSLYSNLHTTTPPLDSKKAQDYLLQAVEKSYIPAVIKYIFALEGDEDYQKLGFKPDPIKGFALASFLNDIGGSSGTLGEIVMGNLEKTMTSEQIKQAEAFKEQWVKTHPPITNGSNKLTNVNATNEYE